MVLLSNGKISTLLLLQEFRIHSVSFLVRFLLRVLRAGESANIVNSKIHVQLFSSQTLYDPAFISFYNVFYTSLPVLALGIFDQDVDDRVSSRYPLLYTPGHMDLLFNKIEFLKSVAHGIGTSFVLFFIPYGAFSNAIGAEGVNLGK